MQALRHVCTCAKLSKEPFLFQLWGDRRPRDLVSKDLPVPNPRSLCQEPGQAHVTRPLGT